ncbi:MAG: putative toxin-antitoxin system toxin component, PIN family [Bacteroidales bacterium]|nr:putative toxin-antitoxin system toxin component, PIN family [Bacteroidales bacterium]
MKTKTVFDTNIWVSYFLKGNFKELVEMVFDYDVDFYRAKELTREISDVLTRNKLKKYLTLPISEYIRFYERLSILIKIKLEFSGCRDPKDNFLFDLAYQSNSKYLVSGDKDVMETELKKKLEVITLTKFKERICI